MSKSVLVLVSLFVLTVGFAGGAFATIVDNDPSNDVMAGATLLSYSGATPWSDIGNCVFTSSSDVDFFAINLNADNVLTVATTPLDNNDLTDPDSYVALLDASGSELVSSANPGGNTIRYKVSSTDTYYIKAYTSSSDSGDYSLTVGVTHLPEPATIGLLVLGSISLLIGKRRKLS